MVGIWVSLCDFLVPKFKGAFVLQQCETPIILSEQSDFIVGESHEENSYIELVIEVRLETLGDYLLPHAIITKAALA